MQVTSSSRILHLLKLLSRRKNEKNCWEVKQSHKKIITKNALLDIGSLNTDVLLNKGEKRIRDVLDNMLESCQIIDYDWRYICVNDAVAKHGRTTKKSLLFARLNRFLIAQELMSV
jgi:hypothetical protein